MRGPTSNARELKLYCLRESADELVERAERSQLGYREFLDLVLEDEAGVLEGRRYASHRSSQRCPTTRRSTTSTPSSSPSPGLEQLTQKRGDVSLHLDHSLNLLELGLGALGASAWPCNLGVAGIVWLAPARARERLKRTPIALLSPRRQVGGATTPAAHQRGDPTRPGASLRLRTRPVACTRPRSAAGAGDRPARGRAPRGENYRDLPADRERLAFVTVRIAVIDAFTGEPGNSKTVGFPVGKLAPHAYDVPLEEATPPASDSPPPRNGRSLRVQLWSYNYDPEPTGIGPVSKVAAEGLLDRGHRVDVVAAHPHYPEPRWGTRRLPYREVRNGIPVLRLPLWAGRASTAERYRQELTYMASQFAALPVLGRPDIVVSASPSFPALLPAIVNARMRDLPWLLWLHDLLPDGAASTGLVEAGRVLTIARRLERAAYREADLIVVLSSAFTENLVAKGVHREKIRLLYDPATRIPSKGLPGGPTSGRAGRLRLLSMGNIGFSQGLAPLVESFECSHVMSEHDVRLIITGNGVAAEGVREKINSDRVEMLGLVDDARLEEELQLADVALVTQQYAGAEFNIPSKLMNFMAYGLPVLAAVNPRGEVAHIVNEAGAGWVVDSSQPGRFPEKVADLLDRPQEIAERGAAAATYAERHFTQSGYAERLDAALHETIARAGGRAGYRTPASAAASS